METGTIEKTDTTNQVVSDESGTYSEVFKLAAPLVVSFLSFSFMGIVDTLIMGHVGIAEQGAVGFAAALAWLLGSLFVGTISVINTFVAQDFGAQRNERIREHVYTGFLLAPLFAAILWSAIPYFPSMIELLGTDQNVAPHTLTYLTIRIFGAPMLMCNFVVTSYLRGLGDMRTPMIVTLIANLINAMLSIVLVFGYLSFPAMGVSGAAWASVAAATIESAAYLFVFLSKKHHTKYQTRKPYRPKIPELKRFLRIGLPIGFAWTFEMVAWTAFTVYASTLDPNALAAHMIVFQIIHLSFLPATALVVVGTTLVGQYLGAKRVDLASRSARNTIVIGVGYMSLAGLFMAISRTPVMQSFNPDPKVIEIGVQLMLIAAVIQPIDAVGIVIGGILRGASDTQYPMIVMILCGSFVFIPGVFFMGEYLQQGIVGAWLAAIAHVIVVAVAMGLRYRTGKWKVVTT